MRGDTGVSDKEPPAYRVYVIELSPEVLGKKRVADENADRRADKPCVYVGQTARTPEERFAQHKDGKRSSRIVREYGVKLKPRLYRNVGPFATRAEAESAESRLAEKLRRRGYAVWSR
jgi:predicted GIY-YIG superfamily endonuclease